MDGDRYTTTLAEDGWYCDCPGAFNGNPDEVMPAIVAEEEARHHAEYYSDAWPHHIDYERWPDVTDDDFIDEP